MLNQNYTLTSYDTKQALLAWSAANATDVSYVFVNGCIVLSNFIFSTTDRVMLIPFRTDRAVTIEIHDFTATDNSCYPIEVPSNKLPIVAWKSVENAVQYRIYCNNKLLHALAKQEDVVNYQKQIVFPELYGKVWTWHFFTVTSVDKYGNESVLKYFPYFIYDLPPIVKEIAVSNGSGAGLYNFTITL